MAKGVINDSDCRKRAKSADIDFFSSFIFKENHVLVEEGNPSEKNVIAKKELDDIDINAIGNLEDLLRIVFIHQEYGNLKAFIDGGDLNRIINKKKKPGVLQIYRCSLCDKCFMPEYFCNKLWNVVNQ